MSYKPPHVIPIDKYVFESIHKCRPLVKDNKYIDSSTLLSQFKAFFVSYKHSKQ